MSLSVQTISCNKCAYESWDLRTWGLRQYQFDNCVQIDLDSRLGWCNECENVAAVEYISAESAQQELEEAEVELAQMRFHPNKLWSKLAKVIAPDWYSKQFDYWLLLQDRRDSAVDKVALIAERTNPPKCLACGGGDTIWPLIKKSTDWNLRKFPQPTGTLHQNCGGELQVRSDGTRFDMVPTLTLYKPSGLKVEGSTFNEREDAAALDVRARWRRNYTIRHGRLPD